MLAYPRRSYLCFLEVVDFSLLVVSPPGFAKCAFEDARLCFTDGKESNCCSGKAGLRPDAWKDPATEVSVFTAEIIEEGE